METDNGNKDCTSQIATHKYYESDVPELKKFRDDRLLFLMELSMQIRNYYID